MTHIGIDPGGKGGIAILHDDGRIEVTSILPHCSDLLYWMRRKIGECEGPIHIMMEKVQGYIGSFGNKGGQQGNTGQSMFEFGKVYGRLEMMITALKSSGSTLHNAIVPPNTWQRALGVPPRVSRGVNKESKGQHKAKLARIARTHFPQKYVTLETADALLLAKYSKEVYKWNNEHQSSGRS